LRLSVPVEPDLSTIAWIVFAATVTIGIWAWADIYLTETKKIPALNSASKAEVMPSVQGISTPIKKNTEIGVSLSSVPLEEEVKTSLQVQESDEQGNAWENSVDNDEKNRGPVADPFVVLPKDEPYSDNRKVVPGRSSEENINAIYASETSTITSSGKQPSTAADSQNTAPKIEIQTTTTPTPTARNDVRIQAGPRHIPERGAVIQSGPKHVPEKGAALY
jgi:hypothetical protein